MSRHTNTNVFKHEVYSNDVVEAIMDNIKKKYILKQQTLLWGPTNTSLSWKNNLNLFQTETENVHENKFKNESASSTQATVDKEERRRGKGIPLHPEDDQRTLKSLSVKENTNLKSVELKNGHTFNDYSKMSQTEIMSGMHSNEPVDRVRKVSRTENKDEFSDWCKKRQIFFNESKLKLSSETTACNKRQSGKRIRPKSKSPVLETRKMPSVVNARHSQKFSKSMSELDIHRNLIKTQVCIKIVDEREEKKQDFTVAISDLSRMKRSFPKLKEVLPDVDAGVKTVQFSMETLIFVLRFALFRRYSKDEMPSATVGVEILAAVKTWEINDLQHLFLKDFLQKTLLLSNISLVFSQASHYGLNDVCDFCKEIAVDGISLPQSTYQRKKKICFITISTYIEPLEFPIPFYPIEENFELSFERHIQNTIRFQALSSSFTLIGFHFQLNGSYLEKSDNLNNLEIEYTVKNISEGREVETERCEKPLRQINVIYFSKPLVAKPKQTVEITVETDTKPYLCSAFPKDKELLKKGRDGEFHLTIDSDFKLSKSGHNLCMIGTLLYNKPELLNGKMN